MVILAEVKWSLLLQYYDFPLEKCLLHRDRNFTEGDESWWAPCVISLPQIEKTFTLTHQGSTTSWFCCYNKQNIVLATTLCSITPDLSLYDKNNIFSICLLICMYRPTQYIHCTTGGFYGNTSVGFFFLRKNLQLGAKSSQLLIILISAQGLGLFLHQMNVLDKVILVRNLTSDKLSILEFPQAPSDTSFTSHNDCLLTFHNCV